MPPPQNLTSILNTIQAFSKNAQCFLYRERTLYPHIITAKEITIEWEDHPCIHRARTIYSVVVGDLGLTPLELQCLLTEISCRADLRIGTS